MDIADIMTKYSTDKDTEQVDEDVKPWAPKHGPQGMRLMTNGQIRRAQKRAQATQRRKTTKRYRIGWIHNQFQIAVLRSKLQVLGLVAYHPAGPLADYKADSESKAFIEANAFLEKRYGSVAEALTQFNKIMVERRAQATEGVQ